jgi:multidrug efflux pump subunit AcrA (membrane-fusion protein)
MIAIPLEALVTSPEGDFLVWVMDPDTQRVTPRQVVIGLMAGQGVLVTSGLSSGDVIVVAGAQHLRPGLQIAPIAS